jgi:hypothetical protein
MNVTFRTPLRLEKQDGDKWKVLERFDVMVADALVSVPEGYETDLASVPRLPLAYLIAGNRAPKSALIHDYLYETQAGRDYADDVFLAAMKEEGVSSWIAKLMYFGVRVGGEERYAV